VTTVATARRRAERAPAPRGRDEVRAALLDAAADLFAARGPAAVSVRDVAARAGVNHGLVHRHFGSKEALVAATLEQLAAAAAAPVPDARSADELGRLVGRTVDERFWRVLAWSLLEGREPAGLQAHFPVLDELVRLVGREHRDAGSSDDPRLVVVQAVAFALGSLLFEAYLRHAVGLGDADDARAANRERWLSLLAPKGAP